METITADAFSDASAIQDFLSVPKTSDTSTSLVGPILVAETDSDDDTPDIKNRKFLLSRAINTSEHPKVLFKKFSLKDRNVAPKRQLPVDVGTDDASDKLLKRFKGLKASGVDKEQWDEFERSGLTVTEWKEFVTWKALKC